MVVGLRGRLNRVNIIDTIGEKKFEKFVTNLKMFHCKSREYTWDIFSTSTYNYTSIHVV